MAEVETSLVTNMKTKATVTAYVGDRIYEDEPDVPREPYIVVRPTSNPRGAWTQSEYGGVSRLSVYVYAETKAKARTIGSAVLAVYKQFNGTLSNHTVQYTEISNARTLFGPDDDVRYLVDIIFHYT